MNLDYDTYGNCFLCALFIQDTRTQKGNEFIDIQYVPRFEKLEYKDSNCISEKYLKIIKVENICALPDPTYCNGDYAKEQICKHKEKYNIK